MSGGGKNLSRCLIRTALEHLSSLSIHARLRLLITAIFSSWNFSFKKRLQFRVQKMTSGCKVSPPPSACNVHTRFTNFEQYSSSTESMLPRKENSLRISELPLESWSILRSVLQQKTKCHVNEGKLSIQKPDSVAIKGTVEHENARIGN